MTAINMQEFMEKARANGKAPRGDDSRERANEQSGILHGANDNFELIPFHDFINDYEPPSYLIKGILQRNRLYSMTGLTGHGKTAVALAMSVDLARAGKRVIYVAVENPDDIQARLVLMVDRMNFDPSECPSFHFQKRAFSIPDAIEHVREKVKAIGGADLVVVDTGAAMLAHTAVEDENSNLALLQFALHLRALTEIEGRPTVLVLMHPTKNCSREHLFPRGGGAFLNEVDGNLAIWANSDRTAAELTTCGKFRGPDFELHFAFEKATCDKLRSAEGDQIFSVWARQLSEEEAQQVADKEGDDAQDLLDTMAASKGASIAQLAEYLGWLTPKAEPHKSRVQRAMKKLVDAKFAQQDPLTKAYSLTGKGQGRVKND